MVFWKKHKSTRRYYIPKLLKLLINVGKNVVLHPHTHTSLTGLYQPWHNIHTHTHTPVTQNYTNHGTTYIHTHTHTRVTQGYTNHGTTYIHTYIHTHTHIQVTKGYTNHGTAFINWVHTQPNLRVILWYTLIIKIMLSLM
jgi:hypothetical protein